MDVFFVISGYLMAAILYPQMRDFPRQLPGFYVKRLKRVFPALFVLLAILLLLLPHLLIPSDLQVAAKEVKYAALFWYNNKFSLSGYFDVAADERWLLHTWTLGLEFQFYLIFPFLLWVAYKIGKSRRKTALLLLALAVILFAAMLWQGGRNHDKAFFLLPYRMWEFLIGSVLFLWDDEQTKVRRPLVYAGWAALLAFLLLVDEGATWPDMRTL